MTIKIPYQWSWTSSSFKHNYIKNIRRLMVEENGQWVEKYRLVIPVGRQREQLIYAKGKIKLNYNDKYKDSNGVEHKITSFNENDEIFAFYEDGFYKKDSLGLSREDYFCLNSSWNNNNSLESMFSLLNVRGNRRHFTENKIYHDYGYERPILPLSKGGIVFIGWYTDPTGGKKIDSVQDLLRYTDLFGYKDNNSLPEITLYAHWKIPTFALRINNIRRKGINSSFQFYDIKNKKWTNIDSYAKLNGLIYGTNISLFLKNNVRKVTYTSWAQEEIKGLSSQKFLGWGVMDLIKTKTWYNSLDSQNASQILKESSSPSYYDSDEVWKNGSNILDWRDRKNIPVGYRDEVMSSWSYSSSFVSNPYSFGFMTKDWTIYPHFKALVVWKGVKIGNKEIKTKTKSYLDENNAYINRTTWEKDQPKIPSVYTSDRYGNRHKHLFSWEKRKYDSDNETILPYSSTIIFNLKEI